jgi:hypothetical protein
MVCSNNARCTDVASQVTKEEKKKKKKGQNGLGNRYFIEVDSERSSNNKKN